MGSSKRKLRETIAWGDPRDDTIWQAWLDSWPSDSHNHAKREGYIIDYLTAIFVVEHWHGGVRAKGGATDGWDCDAFDPLTNLCTAHADRPPICSGYPWYGKDPSDVAKKEGWGLSVNCSFWADLPEEVRPDPVKVIIGRTRAA
jgi:hypothetical protein